MATLYSGFSGGLSLLQTAPLDLQQVEVIKALLLRYGGGAIAGLLNVSKTKEERKVLCNGTSHWVLDVSRF
jgi:iron complex outermembrane receptor protein